MGFSKKMMGKEVGDAAVYAPPHTMKGKSMSINQKSKVVDPNTLSGDKVTPRTSAMRVSLGNPNADDIKMAYRKLALKWHPGKIFTFYLFS